jgi:hypothetical protein
LQDLAERPVHHTRGRNDAFDTIENAQACALEAFLEMTVGMNATPNTYVSDADAAEEVNGLLNPP